MLDAGHGVEVVRPVDQGEVVVAAEGDLAALAHGVHALHRFGPVADQVPQADDRLDLEPLQLLEDGAEGLVSSRGCR